MEEITLVKHNTKLRQRMTLHRQRIRDSKYLIKQASGDIAQCTQNKEIKFTVFSFYEMTTEDDDTRCTNEEYFIKKFKSAYL